MKNLKTFEAKTMSDAIAQVKRRLGRDAVILHTRTLSKGGVFGFGGQPVVEVTAAAGDSQLPPAVRRGIVKKRTGKDPISSGLRLAGRWANGVAMPADGASSRGAPVSDPDLLVEIGELRSMIADLVRDSRLRRFPTFPEELLETYTRLIQADVAEDVAVQLVEQLRADLEPGQMTDPQAVRERLARYVESMLPVAGPIHLTKMAEPTIIALIGPTGVGKTTTIAKLAANFRLRERKKVGLITIDTYRIAAVDQLRTYAQIIDVPLEVVTTPSQLRDAVDAMRDCDVVLLDTAGRSQNDRIKLNELKCFLDEAKPHEVHLVLSSAANVRVLSEAIERFGTVGIDRVIFTKLDEAAGFGAILSCLSKVKARLSYVTVGQDVPEDIEVGRGRRIAELIVNGGRLASCPE